MDQFPWGRADNDGKNNLNNTLCSKINIVFSLRIHQTWLKKGRH